MIKLTVNESTGEPYINLKFHHDGLADDAVSRLLLNRLKQGRMLMLVSEGGSMNETFYSIHLTPKPMPHESDNLLYKTKVPHPANGPSLSQVELTPGMKLIGVSKNAGSAEAELVKAQIAQMVDMVLAKEKTFETNEAEVVSATAIQQLMLASMAVVKALNYEE